MQAESRSEVKGSESQRRAEKGNGIVRLSDEQLRRIQKAGTILEMIAVQLPALKPEHADEIPAYYIAGLLGLSRVTIQKMMKNKVVPDPVLMFRVEKHFGVDLYVRWLRVKEQQVKGEA